MKTPIDYVMEWISDEKDLRILIEEVQTEAWNEAIEAAKKNVRTKKTQVVMYPNQTNSYTVDGIEVDLDSLEKLKI